MHPNEWQWRELLDGEADPQLMSELTEHLAVCPACTTLLARVTDEEEEAAALLQMLDPPASNTNLDVVRGRAQRRSARRGQALLAAGIGLFVVSVAGATIRSGALHRLVVGRRSEPSPVTAPATALPVQRGGSSNGIAIQAGRVLTISFDAPQDAGDLLVIIAPDSSVSVVASDTVQYALGPTHIRVANRGAAGDYRITLPERLEHASIRVADQVVFTKAGATVLTSGRKEGGRRYRLSLTRNHGRSR